MPEMTTLMGADGINLCFTRGPHLLWYEQPILGTFREMYGEDTRKVDPKDSRLHRVRASFMTDFMRQRLRVLDEVGAPKAIASSFRSGPDRTTNPLDWERHLSKRAWTSKPGFKKVYRAVSSVEEISTRSF